MESIAELEQARNALKQNIENVNENIKKLTGRDPEESRRLSTNRRIPLKRNSIGQTSIAQQNRRPNQERRRWSSSAFTKNLDSGGEEEEKKKPAVHSSVVATGSPMEIKKPKIEDTETKKRNKRMLGFMLGTLRQFKQESQFKSATDTKREEKLNKVEDQVQKDKEDAIRERRELYQKRREQQKELKEIEFKLEMAELVKELKNHYDQMEDSIQLKSTPRIFYKPAQHNDKTKKLLEESRESLAESLKHRLREIEMCTEEDVLNFIRPRKGSSSRNPVVIDLVPPKARDLFAEDAANDKLEREAAAQVTEDTTEEKAADLDVMEVDKKTGDVVIDGNDEIIVSGIEESNRVVVDESMDIAVVPVEDGRKVELSHPQVDASVIIDSQDVVNSYNVVDERLVELNRSPTNHADIDISSGIINDEMT